MLRVPEAVRIGCGEGCLPAAWVLCVGFILRQAWRAAPRGTENAAVHEPLGVSRDACTQKVQTQGSRPVVNVQPHGGDFLDPSRCT